jgi:hypothetical protein
MIGLRGHPELASGRVRQGQDNGATGWRNGKWVAALGRCGKGRRDREREAGRLRKIGPKELREYKKEFPISRI